MNYRTGTARQRPVRDTRIRLLANRSARAVALRKASPRPLPRRIVVRENEVNEFRRTVLDYFRAYGRHDLPWRKTRNPYHILVSEMMLQQTQVHRVVSYFERWIKKYPTPHTLAAAPLSEVLGMWSGLGYNRRAKYLHDAAKIIAEHPKHPLLPVRGRTEIVSAEELRELPGVGEYTAKAVRVFAWNQPEVLIETNVRTVFIHHFFPRARMVSDARLLPLIEAALDRGNPRQWYAALMDYGTHLKSTHPNPSRKSKHYTKQSKFEGSLRQVRGEILKTYVRDGNLESLQKMFGEKFSLAYQQLLDEGLVRAGS